MKSTFFLYTIHLIMILFTPNKTIFDLMFTFFGLKGKQLFLHANMQVCVCFSTKRLRNKVCY